MDYHRDKYEMSSLTKEQIRVLKKQHRYRKLHSKRGHLDVGCLLHGKYYDWIYVERLHNMVSRHFSVPVTMHIWTEHDRSVPPEYIKHCLTEWPGISGPKKSWWYKLQLFDPAHFDGDLLYFDLDVVICNELDWILEYDPRAFWTLRDFRYLQRGYCNRMNSSIMWWNVPDYGWIWQKFLDLTPVIAQSRYHGDQDFLQDVLGDSKRFFPDNQIQSWRWSARDGGFDFTSRKYRTPNTGTQIHPGVSVLVFHGHPKPHETTDAVIQQFWC